MESEDKQEGLEINENKIKGYFILTEEAKKRINTSFNISTITN